MWDDKAAFALAACVRTPAQMEKNTCNKDTSNRNEEVLAKHVHYGCVQVRSQFRKIFVAMGFEEMMTNAYVENRSTSLHMVHTLSGIVFAAWLSACPLHIVPLNT